jgi:hypothetical protein
MVKLSTAITLLILLSTDCLCFRLLMIGRNKNIEGANVNIPPSTIDRRAFNGVLVGTLLLGGGEICQAIESSPPIPSAEQIEKGKRKKMIEVSQHCQHCPRF